MRNFIIALVLLFGIAPALAGNKLPNQVFRIDSNGFNLGGRADYIISQNPVMVFDADYPKDLAQFVVERINEKLVDIQISYTFSDVDYDSSTELFSLSPERINRMYAPNRFFLHLGRGWAQGGFAANLRAYETGSPACFIRHRKDQYVLASFSTQANITIHEIFHCLVWNHPENNPYVGNFDFDNQDNVEVLERLYDIHNAKQRAIVHLQLGAEPVGFVSNKKKDRLDSVYTTDDTVKLRDGKYKLILGDKYVCKNKKIKCAKLKKAKTYKFKKNKEYLVYINEKGKVKLEEIN